MIFNEENISINDGALSNTTEELENATQEDVKEDIADSPSLFEFINGILKVYDPLKVPSVEAHFEPKIVEVIEEDVSLAQKLKNFFNALRGIYYDTQDSTSTEYDGFENSDTLSSKHQHNSYAKEDSKSTTTSSSASSSGGFNSGDDDNDDDNEDDDDKKYRGVNRVEKSQSPIWKDAKPYRGNIKTNGLSGSDKRYYKWDDYHKEIEVYDKNGKPIDAIDPITGQRLYKDVSWHKPIDL